MLLVKRYGTVRPYPTMVRGIPHESSMNPETVGRRLRALRSALNLSQDRIAAAIGMGSGSASWSPYESGRLLIPIHNAKALCDIYGITLDWLYRGVWYAGFPYDLRERIEARLERPKKRAD